MLSVQVKSNPVVTNSVNSAASESPPASQATDGENFTDSSLEGVRLPVSRYVLFFCIAGAGVVADLVTKYVAFEYYFDPTQRVQPPHWWIEGIFGLQTATNPGALFGMGSGYSWLFAILSVVAISVIVGWLFLFQGARDRWLTLTLALITGGILGNLYDRMGLGAMPNYPQEIHTNVRDWILFNLQGVPFFEPWPNFNLADCWLVCGAALLFFHALFLTPEIEQDVVTKTEQKSS